MVLGEKAAISLLIMLVLTAGRRGEQLPLGDITWLRRTTLGSRQD